MLSRPELLQTLERAEQVVHWMGNPQDNAAQDQPQYDHPLDGQLHVGVDLGTAYLVLVVLDQDMQPIAGEYQFAQVVRDGLVVDFIGAVDRLTDMKRRMERRLGRELTHASTGFPPGVPRAEIRATGNVLEAAGLRCTYMVDEPSAANALLQLKNGAIVDIGGGTTGIAILRDGEVVYTADEATGGTHFSLVIAGALDITFEAAEVLKTNPNEQTRLFPVIRPVMEKVASIVKRHVSAHQAQSGQVVEQLVLVGGTSKFQGIAQVVEEFTGLATYVPDRPLFITPMGIAMHDRAAS